MATAPDQFAYAGGLTVRPMRDADVGEVIGIERSSYQFPWTEGIFYDCLRVAYLCRVALQGQRIMGYAVMSMGAGEAHILNLCVRQESRRMGVGRALIRYLLEQAEDAGMAEAFLEVREVLVEIHDLGGERMGCAEMLCAPNTCVVVGAGDFCQRHLRGVVVEDATISLYQPG